MAARKLTVAVRLLPGGVAPRYQTRGAAGLDLCAAADCEIAPGAFGAISTGIVLEIPEGYEGQVRPRSGLALKHGIGVLNSPGTIDSDYRGEVKVILFNFGKETFRVTKGDRIAQLVFSRTVKVEWRVRRKLRGTRRGASGFGHTGHR